MPDARDCRAEPEQAGEGPPLSGPERLVEETPNEVNEVEDNQQEPNSDGKREGVISDGVLSCGSAQGGYSPALRVHAEAQQPSLQHVG